MYFFTLSILSGRGDLPTGHSVSRCVVIARRTWHRFDVRTSAGAGPHLHPALATTSRPRPKAVTVELHVIGGQPAPFTWCLRGLTVVVPSNTTRPSASLIVNVTLRARSLSIDFRPMSVQACGSLLGSCCPQALTNKAHKAAVMSWSRARTSWSGQDACTGSTTTCSMSMSS